MTEKLAVYGSFGDGSTIHRDVFGVFAVGHAVDDLGDHFFPDATFTCDQDGNVGWCNANGLLQGQIQLVVVANDPESLFYRL